ncbi:hypothetical protein F5Y07DRAFT_379768 [Xylaria sp. FL0933]|nr:hypothetical protein F5Y07DRAFT_379768 [Xylaria sp. FL0933]
MAETTMKSATTIEQPKPNPSKRPYAAFLDDVSTSSNTFVLDWLKSVVGSDQNRKRRCRSAPALTSTLSPNKRNVSSFSMPPPSSSAPSCPGSTAPTDVTSDSAATARSSKRLVADPDYRNWNLKQHNIFLRDPFEELPTHIDDLVRRVTKIRSPPGPSVDEVKRDKGLYILQREPVDEASVEKVLYSRIFPC